MQVCECFGLRASQATAADNEDLLFDLQLQLINVVNWVDLPASATWPSARAAPWRRPACAARASARPTV